jgi:hypothetical protein
MKPFDIQEFARDLAMGRNAIASEIDAGKWIKIGHEFAALEAQFRAAQADPKVVMPSALSLAIEGVLMKVARPAGPYASVPSQRRSELELTTDGRQLEPGK